MATTLTLLQQVLIMFLLAGVGYLMFKTGKLSLEGSKCIGNILIFLALPCVIINGFLVERTMQRLTGLLYSTIAAIVILFVSVLISKVFFKKDAIAGFAAAFSNPGFFGVPLIAASFGEGTVFYIAAFIALVNLLQWTYGVSMLTGEKTSLKPRALCKAPFLIAIMIGLFFFLTGFSMPFILSKSISFLSGLNTPLAMFTIGVYMAQTDIYKMLSKRKLYFISFIRLLLIPLAAILVLYLIPVRFGELKMSILIAAACPVGANVAVYAQIHNKNYSYAVETVIISTALSIITIPIMVYLADKMWI